MTPVALAKRYSGEGIYLHQHAERVCAERGCGAPVREQRASWNRTVIQLRCERVPAHAGHKPAPCGCGRAA